MREILCDVDGVVADLMGGFSNWLTQFGLPRFDTSALTKFDLRRAVHEPELQEYDSLLREKIWTLDGEDGGLNKAFMTFMNGDAYDWVKTIPGAQDGIESLLRDNTVYFVTAVMDRAPGHMPSKILWMKRNFPDVEYFTAPSKLKQQVRGDIGIDDRYDTCMRWTAAGLKTFMFKQPWNEAPEGHPAHDWPSIVEAIKWME